MHGGRLRQAADLSFQPGGTIRRAAIQASPSSSSIPTARTPSRTRGGPSPTLISRSRWRTERPIRSANCLFVRISASPGDPVRYVSHSHTRRSEGRSCSNMGSNSNAVTCCCYPVCGDLQLEGLCPCRGGADAQLPSRNRPPVELVRRAGAHLYWEPQRERFVRLRGQLIHAWASCGRRHGAATPRDATCLQEYHPHAGIRTLVTSLAESSSLAMCARNSCHRSPYGQAFWVANSPSQDQPDPGRAE
jgi:hypothetical protein